jgi:phosphate transport system permease protein
MLDRKKSSIWSKILILSPDHCDQIFHKTTTAISLGNGLLVAGILGFLVTESWPALSQHGWQFLVDQQWNPTRGQFTLWPMLLGSLAAALLATLLATPLSLGLALYSAFWAPAPVKRILQLTLDLLAGIPSVVFGFWGLLTLTPLLYQWHPPGANLLAAGLILAIMIIPSICLFALHAFNNLPASLLNSAYALGLSRFRLVTAMLLPFRWPQIGSGILMGLTRALGETMVVMMVSGNIVQLPGSIWEPIRTLTANIALEMAYALDMHRSVLFASALLLLITVLGLLTLITFIDKRRIYEGEI